MIDKNMFELRSSREVADRLVRYSAKRFSLFPIEKSSHGGLIHVWDGSCVESRRNTVLDEQLKRSILS